MNGLSTTLRCAALTALALTSWTGVAAAQNGPTQQTNDFSNAYVEGFSHVAIADNGKMKGEVFAKVQDGDTNGMVSITKFKLQRRRCGSHKWQTKLLKPSKNGFSVNNDFVSGYASRDGRGLWRTTAFVAYKRRPGAEVVYREKVSSGKLGDCHPVPPAS